MKKFIIVLALLVFTSSQAFASVGFKDAGGAPSAVADIDCYPGTACSVDGTKATIDGRIAGITSGTIDGAVIGSSSPALMSYKTPISVISASASTLTTTAAYNGVNSTVTEAKSGYMFVLGPTASSAGGANPYVLTLPGTYNTTITGLTYTFTTATAITLAVRTASATDSVIYYGKDTCTRLTSPASSGSTITIVGDGSAAKGKWFIKSMAHGDNTDNKWTAGTF